MERAGDYFITCDSPMPLLMKQLLWTFWTSLESLNIVVVVAHLLTAATPDQRVDDFCQEICLVTAARLRLPRHANRIKSDRIRASRMDKIMNSL